MTKKIRTPESRAAEAKVLRERLRRAPADPTNPKQRPEPVKVLTPAERGGVKGEAKPKVEEPTKAE